jgi:hypothetical protein
MNRSQPYAEAVAIEKGRIVKVGTSEDITPLLGKSTKIINLSGKTVVPGFIDTHIHVLDFGKTLAWLDLRNVKSIEEMQNSLRERVQKTPKGKWVIGRGWDQTRFKQKRLPKLSDLDSVSPENPVILYHQSALICVANSKALELAGVTKQTNVPLGGAIDKDLDTGELTGILRDAATDLVWKVIPEPDEDELLEDAALACEKIAEAGVTSVHWMVLSAAEIPIAQKLLAQKRLPIRVNLIIPACLLDTVADFSSKDNLNLRVGGAVIAADGYLAAKTAALSQPYSDDSSSGKTLCTQEEMNASATRILKASLQLVIHAMGDKAVETALTAIEKASRGLHAKDTRPRLEQAAVLSEELIERMKKQKAIVSVQPLVIKSEFSVWHAEEHLGAERARWLYPLKTLLKKGVRVVGGSDCPMEPLNPLIGIQAAVTREFYPEERITVDEALRMYTVDAAFSTSQENIKGTIEEGKLADLTVLSRDARTVPPDKIDDVTVEITIVGGKVIHS